MKDFDYIVRDSSILPSIGARKATQERDSSIRIGIVREMKETEEGPIYSVEVFMEGKVAIVGCTAMTKWGGAHNFEEYKLRSWLHTAPELLPPPVAWSEYKNKSGDVVVVAFLSGKSKEGIILGCINHNSRQPKLKDESIAYLSEFNGLETSIRDDGTYKVSFKGYTKANDPILKVPKPGVNVPAPIYNPLVGGSYFGFSSNGSYIASDGKQSIKIHKNIATGSIIISSGTSQLELGGNPALGNFSVKTGKIVAEATTTASIKSTVGLALESLQVSIKGTQVAIGSDQFELFDGLVQLIDALGSLVVTSPVGTCTPLMTAPTWAAQVLPLKIKIMMTKGSLKSADSFSLSGDDDPTIEASYE